MNDSTKPECHLPVFIIGYMGCGKTTFGRALARKLNRQFIDLDLYIENRFRNTVNGLFAERGEEGFRKIESSMLREAGEFCDVVISCGGGTPCFLGNMDYMLRAGNVIFLSAGTGCITRRLLANRSKRPLVRNIPEDELETFVAENLARRLPVYEKAPIHFKGEELENAKAIEMSINRFLDSYDV